MVERRAQGDEARQVAVFGAQSIERPRPQAWSVEDAVAGVQAEQGWAMRHLVAAVHRPDDTDFVYHGADMREKVADFNTALPVLFEFPRRGQQITGAPEFELGLGDG